MEEFYNIFTGEDIELPWAAPLSVPNYTEIKAGEWSLKVDKMPPFIRGYYKDIGHAQRHHVNPVLKRGKKVWMSVTPMELESLAPHAHFATGRVIICGLGMGVLLYNILRKPDVTEVIVLENDPDVITMFSQMVEVDSWEGHEKLRIIEADATEYKAEGRIDFVSVDIFQKMMCSTNLATLQKIDKNLKSIAIAGWTTELEFVAWCADKDIPPADVSDDDYDEFCEQSGLPLIRWNGIAQYCMMVGYYTAMA